jgi:hypothetical protein
VHLLVTVYKEESYSVLVRNNNEIVKLKFIYVIKKEIGNEDLNHVQKLYHSTYTPF